MMDITEEFISRREKHPQLDIGLRSQIDELFADRGLEHAGGQRRQVLIATPLGIRRRGTVKDLLGTDLVIGEIG